MQIFADITRQGTKGVQVAGNSDSTLHSLISWPGLLQINQSASDVLHICAYMYTMSRESASLCEKFDVYIGNFGGNNAKGKIKKQC